MWKSHHSSAIHIPLEVRISDSDHLTCIRLLIYHLIANYINIFPLNKVDPKWHDYFITPLHCVIVFGKMFDNSVQFMLYCKIWSFTFFFFSKLCSIQLSKHIGLKQKLDRILVDMTFFLWPRYRCQGICAWKWLWYETW